MEAVILVGGMGTRLASLIPHKPKALAEVCGVPVLDMVINELITQGFNRIILATGVRGEQVQEYAQKFINRKDCQIIISQELSPLGTGGAVRHALPHIISPHFLVINGDTFSEGIDLKDAFKLHAEKNALVTLVAVHPRADVDYGAIEIVSDGRARFREKEGVGALMSAGIYWLNRKAVEGLPEGPLSIEKDFFPRIALEGGLYGYKSTGRIHDIGTPERYKSANEGIHFS